MMKGLDEMKVIMALDPNQNNVTNRQLLRFARRNRNQIAVIDFSLHRITARPNLYRLTVLELFNCELGPTHFLILCCVVAL